MRFKSVSLALLFLAVSTVAILGMLKVQNPPPEVLNIASSDYEIEVFQNSDTLSQATAINAGGSIIGTREAMDETGFILLSHSFYCGQGESKNMPVPDEFTNVEATAISDNDWVVGYASRPSGHEGGSLRAVLWNPMTDQLELLPAAPGDDACHAQGISSDGRRITGYTTGPKRLRPALWTQNKDNNQWEIHVLETILEYNPYLMSSSLLISPDGQRITGCCTEQILPTGVVDSALYVWLETDGKWTRKLVTEEQMYVRGVNNRGEVAGSMLGREGRLPCFVSAEGEVRILELLPGTVSAEARDINESSQIVGWCDDAPGTDGGPQPCLWSADGKANRVTLTASPYAMLYGINDSGQIAGMLTFLTEEEATATSPDEQPAERALAFRAVAIKASSK